jgi:hypothetical protein
VALWNWIFRAGLAISAAGLVWTLWPTPGARAYSSVYAGSRSRYHLGPRVAIDLGHYNDAPADSRFAALGELLTWDGYRVTRSRQRLVPEYLKGFSILLIGNAMPYPAGARRVAEAVGLGDLATFSADEVDAVRDWVRAGGSLLLIADAPHSATAAAPLAAALGATLHDCPAPVFLSAAVPTEHPIREGRSDGERVGSVATLANGWVETTLPAGRAVPILKLQEDSSCAAGKPVALALEFGGGRVVALAAQLERDEDLIRRTGMDPGRLGNRQFVLNAMHWLSRGLD